MRIARRRRLKPHIDMTPLIDCIFQLLIVFMVAAAFQSPAISMALPQAATKDSIQNPEILVSIDERGAVFVNQDRVDLDQLLTRLKPLVERSKQKVVTFRGDEKIPYHLFVKALDAARASGAVSLDVTHKEPSPADR